MKFEKLVFLPSLVFCLVGGLSLLIGYLIEWKLLFTFGKIILFVWLILYLGVFSTLAFLILVVGSFEDLKSFYKKIRNRK